MSDLDKLIARKMDAKDFKSIVAPQWYGIVVHHTGIGNRPLGSSTEGYLRNLQQNIAQWLSKKDSVYVSAHFQIGWFGEIWQLVDPRNKIAFHAGKSSWFHEGLRKQQSNCNNWMIGIELLGDGNMHDFSEAQYKALIELTKVLRQMWPTISINSVAGHEHVSQGRKTDPGKYFNWNRYKKEIQL